jgi:hypothetical protein
MMRNEADGKVVLAFLRTRALLGLASSWGTRRKMVGTEGEGEGERFDMNYDAMPVDGLGKRTLKPLKIIIKNVGKGLEMKEKNVLNIAFGPIILNSDSEILDMMRTKVHSATRRQCALRFIKRFVYS